MTRPLPLLAFSLLPALGACVIHDNDCPGDDFWADDDSGRPDPDDTGAPEEPKARLWLDPDAGAPGEDLIAGLQSDQPFDWSTVAAVEFFGPITPCTMQARQDELLITLAVDDDAPAGPVDLLVELDDGTAIWVDDAFLVLDGSTNGGGTDGSSDGGGTDGSSDGGGTDGGGTSGACG
ncbi:hypothetical protein L6R53_04270 [Myxococcota bacterium]|nr:hypothetical protein [Myxococcota bacterium]